MKQTLTDLYWIPRGRLINLTRGCGCWIHKMIKKLKSQCLKPSTQLPRPRLNWFLVHISKSAGWYQAFRPRTMISRRSSKMGYPDAQFSEPCPPGKPLMFSLAGDTGIYDHSLITDNQMLWPWRTKNRSCWRWNWLIDYLTLGSSPK